MVTKDAESDEERARDKVMGMLRGGGRGFPFSTMRLFHDAAMNDCAGWSGMRTKGGDMQPVN